MTVDDLIVHPPSLHRDPSGKPAGYAVSSTVLRYLDATISPGQHTLETGAGLSTILFAMKGATHTCIAPAPALFERIRAYMAEKDIPAQSLTFVPERSEACLPRLESAPLDLVLIDGRHAFPSPFIDWYYTEPHLKIGGILIVDDIQIWTGAVLRDFLRAAPEWERLEILEGRSAVFRKRAGGAHDKLWPDQPFVARRSSRWRHTLAGISTALMHARFTQLHDMARHYRARRRHN